MLSFCTTKFAGLLKHSYNIKKERGVNIRRGEGQYCIFTNIKINFISLSLSFLILFSRSLSFFLSSYLPLSLYLSFFISLSLSLSLSFSLSLFPLSLTTSLLSYLSISKFFFHFFFILLSIFLSLFLSLHISHLFYLFSNLLLIIRTPYFALLQKCFRSLSY